MAASSSSGIVDPTKTAKYPLILSDALIGKTTTEIFTGVRYNHRPAAISSESSPLGARLKPSVSAGNPSAGYDLSFLDPSTKRVEYTYAGARTTDDGQYVLYFDPARRVFVLDRVDSVFHMNLTRTPDTPDPDALSQQFEQLGTSTRPRPPPAEENDDGEEDAPAEADDDEAVMIMMMEEAAAAAAAATTTTAPAATTTKAEKPKETTKRSAAASAAASAAGKRGTTSSAKTKGSARRDAAASKSAPSSRKPQANRPTKKAAAVDLALPDATSEHPSPALPSRPARPEPTLPTMAPAAAAKKRQLRSRESDDSDDSGGELEVEFPGSSGGGAYGHHAAAPPPARVQIRRFSDFMRENTSADDANPEDEFDEERDLNSFRLPSPARNSGGGSGYYASQLDQDSPMHMDHHGDNGEDDGEDAEEAGAAGADQGAGEADLEDDLEAQLEAELAGEESEVSEED